MKDLTAEEVKEFLRYDAEEGVLVWVKNRNPSKVGKPAGYKKPDGYLYVYILGRLIAAHRLAWLIHHGKMPSLSIDHVNRDKADNRIENLREATDAQNRYNTAPSIANASGYKGVCWHRGKGKWQAAIRIMGQQLHLGYFSSPVTAARAYNNAATEAYGEFAYLNEV